MSARVYDLTRIRQPESAAERAEQLARHLDANPVRQSRGDGVEWVVACPVHDPLGMGRPDLVIQAGTSRPEPLVMCRVCGEEEWSAIRLALIQDEGVPPEWLGSATASKARGAKRLRAVKPTQPVEPIDERTVADWYARLTTTQEGNAEVWEQNQSRLAYLHGQRGLTVDTMRAAQIGWDGERFTIPVADERGRFVNARRYDPAAKAKMVNTPHRGSPIRWFGADALVRHVGEVLVTEGEWDRLLTQQHLDAIGATHLLAISGTGGAGTPPSDVEALRGRSVHIAYDCDDAGRAGARKLADALSGIARAVYIVDLGLQDKQDLTDWFLSGRTADELLELLMEAKAEPTQNTVGFTWLTGDALASTPPPMTWLARGLWQDGSYGVLAGEKKSLKTYTALAMAVGVAAGLPVLGQFDVPKAQPVLYIAGEGGKQPLIRRLHRIAEAYGVKVGELPLHISWDVAALDSPTFRDELTDAMRRFEPGLVILDPLYAFHSASVAASNLYERGPLLRTASDLTNQAGAALVIVDHFNKTGSGSGLERISQAGVQEWVNSWILLSHRTQPDVDAGSFRLAVEIGSRDWGGRDFDLDLVVGAFNDEAGEHDGQIDWDVRPSLGVRADRVESARSKISDELLRVLDDHDPLQLTRTQLLTEVSGRTATKAAALDQLIGERSVIVEDASRDEGGRSVTRPRVRRVETGESKIHVRDLGLA